MSKELDDVYKKYSARIITVDDPPVKVINGGKFKLLTIEEYNNLKQQLVLKEKALELACDKLAYKYCFQIGEDAFCEDCKPCLIDYFKEQAKEMMKSE